MKPKKPKSSSSTALPQAGTEIHPGYIGTYTGLKPGFNFVEYESVRESSDPILALSCAAIVICLIKFLFEGVVVSIAGHTFNFGHADPVTYATLLSPVLGAHSFLQYRKSSTEAKK